MKFVSWIAIALCSIPALARAQDPAPRTDPPRTQTRTSWSQTGTSRSQTSMSGSQTSMSRSQTSTLSSSGKQDADETGAQKTKPETTSAEKAKAETARAFAAEFKRGYDLLVAQKWAEGMAAMQHCLELQPEAPVCAYNLACACARQGQKDAGLGWFEKSVEWGFGYDAFADAIALANDDHDLDALRDDARFTSAMDKARATAKRVAAYVATPATYVPEALDGAESLPLLVVLHASGATKESVVAGRWKQVADELGLALVAPSAAIMRGRDPQSGMDWWEVLDDYANGGREARYEASVTAALDAFEHTHKVDRARTYIAGDAEGGLVALRIAFAHPSTWRGVVACNSGLVPSMLQDKAASARKRGLEVKLLLDRAAFERSLAAQSTQPVDAVAALASWSGSLQQMGFPGAIEAYDPPATSAAPATTAPGATSNPRTDIETQKIVASLRAMQPAVTDAAAPK